jgi:hypothetical protein
MGDVEKHSRLTEEPPGGHGRYEPNEDGVCRICGEGPTVDGYVGNDRFLTIDLCGPHAWGDSKYADPSKWPK